MLKKLKQKLECTANSNTFIKKVNAFLDSKWYLVAFACFVFLFQALGLDGFAFVIIAALFLYISLFKENTNATVPIICFATFCASTVNSPAQKASGFEIVGAGDFVVNAGSTYYSSPLFFVCFIIAVVLVVVGVLYRMFAYADFRKTFAKKSLVWGVLALAVSYLLSGIGYSQYSVDDLVMSLVQAGTLIAIYVYLTSTVDFEKFNLDALASLCVTIIFYIMALVCYIYATRFYGFLEFTGEWKAYMLCGWGMSNDFGIFIAMMMPALFYKMYHSQKYSFVWYIFACLSVVILFFTYARGALLVGAPIFVIGTVVALIRKQNRKTSIITVSCAVCVCAVALVILYFTGAFDAIMEYHIGKVSNGTEFENVSSGRADIWKRYFEYFVSNPIFGGGFTVDKIFYIENGMEVANGAFSAYSYFAHNTLFQLMGSCGIVGLFAYIYHTLTTIIIYFKKPNFKRFIFAFALFGFVATAMLDVVFFKPYFTLIYAVILTVCEADARKCALQSNDKKENENV